MATQADVDAAVAGLTPESQLAARWEISRLWDHLEAGEQLGALARADARSETGLLVATDRRLFFLNTESGSYFIKHTDVVGFVYDDVEQLAFDADGVVITRRADGDPRSARRRALTRIAYGGVAGAVLGSFAPLSIAEGVRVALGALVGALAVAAAQTLTRRRPDAVPGWLGWLSGLAPQLTLKLTEIPPQEAGALYDYVAARAGPLEGRVLDPTDIRTRAAIAASEPPASGQPERWAIASIALGAAVALSAVVAFFAAASAADYCEEQPWWLYAILAGPLLGSVLVAAGFWGTRSPEVRNRAGLVWALIAASFFLTWIALPASC